MQAEPERRGRMVGIMKTFRFYTVSILIISLVVLWGLRLARAEAIQIVEDGANMQMGTILEKSMAVISGPWEFYDNMLYEDLTKIESESKPMEENLQPVLVSIPHMWEGKAEFDGNPFGYGTYRLRLSGFDPDTIYAVYIKDESFSYRLWVNGRIATESGKVGRTIENYEPYLKSRWTAMHSDTHGNIELVMEIANFDYNRAGFWTTMKIGEFSDVAGYINREYLAEMFLFASLFLMALIIFAIYFKTREDRFTLFLGIFSMLVAFRILFTGNRLALVMDPELPAILTDRIMYLLGYLLLPIALYMSISLGYVKKNKVLVYICHAMLVAIIGLTVFGSIDVYTGLYEIYQILVPMAALYFTYLLLKGISRRRPRAIPTAIAYMFAIVGVANEMFVGKMAYSVGLSTLGMIGIFAVVEIDKFYSIKVKKESLETEIMHDRLTGVYNRLYLEQNMNSIIEMAERLEQPVSLILLDLDHFKDVNDRFGHDVGDMVLIGTIEAVKRAIRGTDHIIRWGGEEFLVLANGTNLEGATWLAEKIRITIESASFEKIGRITASFGVAEHFHGETKEDWFKRTDLALYSAKNSGRNRVVAWERGNHLPVGIEHLEWQVKWNCGNDDIDNDHRRLIELSNQLIETAMTDATPEDMEIKIMALLSHISYHFEREESILEDLAYDQLAEHRQLHEALLIEAGKLKLQYSEKRVDVDEFTAFLLGKVVMGHLLFEDSKFFSYMHSDKGL